MGSTLNQGFPCFCSRESWNCFTRPTLRLLAWSHISPYNMLTPHEKVRGIIVHFCRSWSVLKLQGFHICSHNSSAEPVSFGRIASVLMVFKEEIVVIWMFPMRSPLVHFKVSSPHFQKGFTLFFWFSLMNLQQVPGLPQYLMPVFRQRSSFQHHRYIMRECEKPVREVRLCREKNPEKEHES